MKALECISHLVPVEVIEENFCEIEGFSGKTCSITKVAFIKFKVGKSEVESEFKFGVVADVVLPYCFLLGLDFLMCNNVLISYCKLSCNFDGISIPFEDNICDVPNVYTVTLESTEDKSSHFLIPKVDGDLRFEIHGVSNTINGLSLLVENDTIKMIQKSCKQLRSLHKNLQRDRLSKDWASNLKEFKRFGNKLFILDDVLVFGDSRVIVVPFSVVLELAISIHFNFAHVGRDKLNALLDKLVWHPGKSKLIAEICKTCYTCQVFKDNNSAVLPPTLKIATSYPFELVAVDLMSLPRTCSGYVAVLMVVDHYSKFISAVPIRNKQSATVIKALARNVFPFLPCMPTNVLSDNGPEFISDEFSEFLAQSGINHKRTMPYCPTSNGAVERVNKTVQNLIKTLLSEKDGTC